MRKFPRMDVLPLLCGSQAKPIEGPKFFQESLYSSLGVQLRLSLLNPHPRGGLGRSMLSALVTRGESLISQRSPRSTTKLGRTLHVSWIYESYSGKRKSACRNVPGGAHVLASLATNPC